MAIRAKGRATVLVKYFTLDFTGATVLFFYPFSFFFFFYERSLCISHERHESGCHDTVREKRIAGSSVKQKRFSFVIDRS